MKRSNNHPTAETDDIKFILDHLERISNKVEEYKAKVLDPNAKPSKDFTPLKTIETAQVHGAVSIFDKMIHVCLMFRQVSLLKQRYENQYQLLQEQKDTNPENSIKPMESFIKNQIFKNPRLAEIHKEAMLAFQASLLGPNELFQKSITIGLDEFLLETEKK